MEKILLEVYSAEEGAALKYDEIKKNFTIYYIVFYCD
jgi:hypothetical protein